MVAPFLSLARRQLTSQPSTTTLSQQVRFQTKVVPKVVNGDANPFYETNWDIWQQWMNSIFQKIFYIVNPGYHKAACMEFDGPGNIMTVYMNNNITNGTMTESDLTYYSCPPSQRNFTAYQNRFRMPGNESGGVGNFWYSFNYGNAHSTNKCPNPFTQYKSTVRRRTTSLTNSSPGWLRTLLPLTTPPLPGFLL